MAQDFELTGSVRADTSPLEQAIRRIEARGINLKPINSQPLGRITGQVTEFEKSLGAANARVIAFGASAGIIAQVSMALGNMVRQAIDVEKQLTDINSILNTTSSGLEKFGNSLFDIAANTGSTFGQVAEAAKELSRQGLSAEDTLKRTSDALILTRLSGLEAAKSVETLTATVNAFTKEALTSTDAVNRMANVDAAFAVSSGDMAEALSRAGAVAQDASVSFNELISAVTAVQQRTARGGAVIGNAFKTIFTRLERTDTLDKLSELGVAVRDLEGNTLPAINILTQLANRFNELSDSQQANISQTVAGVHQINILKTLLGDLGSKYSIYTGALNTANETTDEAIQRNEALNKTLSALANESLANFTKLSAAAGKLVFGPSLEKIFGGFNNLAKGLDGEGIGTQVGEGILKGIGNALSGPGLVIGGFLAAKLFAGFLKFAAESTQRVLGIGQASEKQRAVQQGINDLLARNPQLYDQILSRSRSLAEQEAIILDIIQRQVIANNQRNAVVQGIAKGVVAGGGSYENEQFKLAPKKYSGYVPNLLDSHSVSAEIEGARHHGYSISPSEVRSMNARINGRQTEVVYNSKERVIPNFAGTGEPAIVPPNKTLRDLYQEKYSNNNFAGGYISKKRPLYKGYAYRDGRVLNDVSHGEVTEHNDFSTKGAMKFVFEGGKMIIAAERKDLSKPLLKTLQTEYGITSKEIKYIADIDGTREHVNSHEIRQKVRAITGKAVPIGAGLRGVYGSFEGQPVLERVIRGQEYADIYGGLTADDLRVYGGAEGFINRPNNGLFWKSLPKTKASGSIPSLSRGGLLPLSAIMQALRGAGTPEDGGIANIFSKKTRGAALRNVIGLLHPELELGGNLKDVIRRLPKESLKKLTGMGLITGVTDSHIDLLDEGPTYHAAGGVAPIGSGLFRNVYPHKKGILSQPKKVEDVYEALRQQSPLFTKDDAKKYLERETSTRPAMQKAIGEAGLGPKVFKIGKDGSYIAERVSSPTLQQSLEQGLMTREEALAMLEKAKAGLAKAGFGSLKDVSFHNVAGNINTGTTSVLDFSGGHVPNLVQLYRNKLEKNPFLVGRQADISGVPIINAPNTAAFTTGFQGHHLDTIIAPQIRHLKKSMGHPILTAFMKEYADRYFPKGFAVRVGGAFGVNTGDRLTSGPTGGFELEDMFSAHYGIKKPSGGKRPDITQEGIDIIRAREGGLIPDYITRGEIKSNAYEFGDKGKDFSKFVGTSAGIAKLPANALKDNIDFLGELIPKHELESFLSFVPREYGGKSHREVLRAEYGLTLASGFVPYKQLNASDAVANGLADSIPGLRDAITRETNGTGISLSDTRVNFLNPSLGLPNLAVTNTRDEGLDGDPRKGFQRVMSKGGRPHLAGSGKEYGSGGHVPNLARSMSEAAVVDLFQGIIASDTSTPSAKAQAQKQLDEILKERNRIAQRHLELETGDLAQQERNIKGREAQALADRKAAKRQQLGFAAAFGVPMIGGVASEFIKDPQYARSATGLTSAFGTGASIASIIPGGAGAAIGLVVGAAQGLKTVLNNLTPSFEDLAKKTEKVVAGHAEQTASIQSFIQAQSELEEATRSGSPIRQKIAGENFSQSILGITDPKIREQLSANANNPIAQQDILAKLAQDQRKEKANVLIGQELAAVGDENQNFTGISRRNFARLNRFLGVDSVSEDLNKATTKEQVNRVVGLSLQGGIGENVASDRLSSLGESIQNLNKFTPNAEIRLQSVGRELGFTVEQAENFANLDVSGQLEALARIISERLNPVSSEIAKSIQAVTDNFSNFRKGLDAASNMFSRISSIRQAQTQGGISNAFSGLEAVNNYRANVGGEGVSFQDQFQVSSLRARAEAVAQLESINKEARGYLRTQSESAAKDDRGFTEGFRKVVSQGATGKENPITALKQAIGLLGGLEGNDAAKSLSQEMSGKLSELQTTMSLVAVTERTQVDLAKQNLTIQKQIASSERKAGALGGLGILGNNSLDNKQSLAGIAQQMSSALSNANPYTQQDRYFAGQNFRGGGALNRSQYRVSRLQQDAEDARIVGRGIQDDFQSGFTPTGADVLDAGGPNSPRGRILEASRKQAEAKLAQALETNRRALITNQATGTVDNLFGQLRATNSLPTGIDSDKLGNRIKAAANNSDFAALRKELLTLREHSPTQGRGAIDVALTGIASLDQQSRNAAEGAKTAAQKVAGGEAPLSNATFITEIGKLLKAQTDLNQILIGVESTPEGDRPVTTFAENATQLADGTLVVKDSLTELSREFDTLKEKLASLIELPVRDVGNSSGAPVKDAETKAAGHLPSFAREQDAINRGVGGARRTDSPIVRNVQGLGLVTMNTGEQVIDNWVPGKAAILNRQMMNAATGLVPNFANVGGISYTSNIRDYLKSLGLSLEDAQVQRMISEAERGNTQGYGQNNKVFLNRATLSPYARRETLAHEGFHARNPFLGKSETLARFYGGFRAPRAANILSRIGSGFGSAIEYNSELLGGRYTGGEYGTFFNRTHSLTGHVGRQASDLLRRNVTDPLRSTFNRFVGDPYRNLLRTADPEYTARQAERNVLSGRGSTSGGQIGLRRVVTAAQRVSGAISDAASSTRAGIGERFSSLRGDLISREQLRESFPTVRNIRDFGRGKASEVKFGSARDLLPTVGRAIGSARELGFKGAYQALDVGLEASARRLLNTNVFTLAKSGGLSLLKGGVAGASIIGNEYLQTQINERLQNPYAKAGAGLGVDAVAMAIAKKTVGYSAAAIGSTVSGVVRGQSVDKLAKENGYGGIARSALIAQSVIGDGLNAVTFGGLRALARSTGFGDIGSKSVETQLKNASTERQRGENMEVVRTRLAFLSKEMDAAKASGASPEKIASIRKKMQNAFESGGLLPKRSAKSTDDVTAKTESNTSDVVKAVAEIAKTEEAKTSSLLRPSNGSDDLLGILDKANVPFTERAKISSREEVTDIGDPTLQQITRGDFVGSYRGYMGHLKANAQRAAASNSQVIGVDGQGNPIYKTAYQRPSSISETEPEYQRPSSILETEDEKIKNYARGYNPISAAISRENSALRRRGIFDPSSIYVGHDSRVGIGVGNTYDEPFGISSGVTRVISQGGNPHASGLPNFAASDNSDSSILESLRNIHTALQTTNASVKELGSTLTGKTETEQSSSAPTASGTMTVDATVRVAGNDASGVGQTIADEIRARLSMIEGNLQTVAQKNKIAFPPSVPNNVPAPA